MPKNEKNEKEIENSIYLKAKKELNDLKQSIGTKSKEETYQNTRASLMTYLISILKEKAFLTEQEMIQKLKNFNIDKKGIEILENLLKRITQIEYNNTNYTNEILYQLIIDSDEAIDEINIQRIAYHQSLIDRIQVNSKEKIISKFESDLKSLKSYYNKKGEIDGNLVITLTEYFNYLPSDKKAQFSRDFHYYCKILPEIISMIKNLENAKEDFEKHQLSASINKLFARLEDEQKEETYPRIINLIISIEQKIDLLMILGYSYISKKKLEKSLEVYKLLAGNFSGLDNEKKKYYQPILIRYLNAVKQIQKNK
jgi:hypothetical protein